MRETKLGERPTDEVRDAVHVAVIAVVAGRSLRPGERVKVVDGKADLAPLGYPYHGVVDPFGPPVDEGERFLMLMKPGTTTNVRHAWEHPDFPYATHELTQEERDDLEHEAWCKQACAHHD